MRKVASSVTLQRIARGWLGRRRARQWYREWVVAHTLQLVQARVRGVFERRRWQRRRIAVLQQRGATCISSAYRGYAGRLRVRRIKGLESDDRRNEVLAVLVQRWWRSYVDRAFVRVLRREAYAKAIEAAKARAVLEVKARLVQGAWRRRAAEQNCDLLRAARDARIAREALELASCVKMQRVLRGHLGRVCFRCVREEYDWRLREWRLAITIQSGFRGMGGRRRAAYMRWLAAKEHEIKMALRIQQAWRANRAR